jgi:hypothetical protein
MRANGRGDFVPVSYQAPHASRPAGVTLMTNVRDLYSSGGHNCHACAHPMLYAESKSLGLSPYVRLAPSTGCYATRVGISTVACVWGSL